MICEMCGEEIERLTCPYCKTVQSAVEQCTSRKKQKIRSVNIKDDMPLADTALSRLKVELHKAKQEGFKALKVIHGYGSSGRGGVIKQEVHRFIMSCEAVANWIPGEDFSAEYTDTLQILRHHPYLENDKDFRKRNRGITILIF
jgi:hypothetical protein